MMIYAGQELGERAIDAEGYSGRDGRTTIFDYWSIPTLRRWYNNGKCNEEHLSQFEISLRNKYKKILSLCNSEKAISDGGFFDLMYVNYNNLNPHKHYVYLRAYEKEVLLIAVNFDNNPCDISIEIPSLAFSCLNIIQGNYSAVELLSGDKKDFLFNIGNKFQTNIEAHNAVIWKLVRKSTDVTIIKNDSKSDTTH